MCRLKGRKLPNQPHVSSGEEASPLNNVAWIFLIDYHKSLLSCFVPKSSYFLPIFFQVLGYLFPLPYRIQEPFGHSQNIRHKFVNNSSGTDTTNTQD
jgi:hypothetical protein